LISNNIFARPDGLSQADFTALVEQYFTVVGTYTIYRGFYYRMELPLIHFLDEVNYLESLRLFSPHILSLDRRFYPGRWNRVLLTPSRTMDRVVIPLARRAALSLLRSRILYGALTTLGKTLLPERSRTQLLILAQKYI